MTCYDTPYNKLLTAYLSISTISLDTPRDLTNVVEPFFCACNYSKSASTIIWQAGWAGANNFLLTEFIHPSLLITSISDIRTNPKQYPLLSTSFNPDYISILLFQLLFRGFNQLLFYSLI